MKSAVAIVVDGVLRKSDHQPIPEGIRLYKTLAPLFNLVLLADHDDPEYAAELEHFLRVEQLDQHSRCRYLQEMYMGSARVAQALQLRNSGMVLDYVVEPDPEEAAKLMLAGFNVMHFMHATYQRPDWRPDWKLQPAPWDELVRREIAAKLAKAGDTRLQ